MSWDYQFVDRITADATVRLDLTSQWTVEREATQFPPPELRRAVVSTLLTDGEQYPAAAYGNRSLRLALKAHAAVGGLDGVAAALQPLMRELDRPTNILRYRPGTSEAVYFRTSRTGPESVRWTAARQQVEVVIPAEPFALGLRETLPQVTVQQDPAAAVNGQFFDASGIRGDVETPLFLRIEQGSITDFRQSVIAVRRRGTPASMPRVVQAETMTLGVDTALGTAGDTAMSGSGQNFIRVSFATQTALTQRASISNWPPAGTDSRGLYRVFLRIRQSNPTDAMQVRLRTSGGVWSSDVVTPATGPGTAPDYVDMGLVQLPTGADPVTDGYSGVSLSTYSPGFVVDVGRTLGVGTLDIDHLLLVPADDRLCVIDWPVDSGLTALVLDSARTMVYAVGAAGEVRTPASMARIAGGTPMVSPGVTNRVVFVQDTGALQSDATNRLTSSTVITPYYWPRYLHVRGVGL